MDYYFRVDASPRIGAGHFFRLLPLMEQLCARNETVWVIGDLDGLPFIDEFLKRIPISGRLSTASHWKLRGDSTLVIDSYVLPANDKIFSHHSWARVVVLGDASTPKYHCDVFIGAGPIASEFERELNTRPGVRAVAGPEYFSLRQDLLGVKRDVQVLALIPQILVIGGGGDANGYTQWVTRALASSGLDFRATIVTDEPLDTMIELDSRFVLQRPTFDLASLYRNATLAFSASGTTALECVALNIPVAVAQTSCNQRDQYLYLTEKFLAFPLGDLDTYLEQLDLNCPVEKAIDWCLQATLSSNGNPRSLLDGQGAERIYAKFLAPGNASL